MSVSSQSHRASQATARRIGAIPIAAILLAVAVLVQVAYALTNTAPPIWDEVGHTRAANALLNLHSFANVSEAVRTSIRYGMVYPLWLASVYAFAGENFFLARLLQGLVAVGTLAFLYLAAREVYGKRAGVVTLALGVLYLPFVSTAARLLSETLALFWLACALWLTARGLKRGDARAFFFAGIVTVLTGLTRPTLQMLFVAIGLAVFVVLRLTRKHLRRGFFFVAGVLLVVVPFLLFTRVTIGRATLSGSVSPFEGIFVGNYIPDGGYPTDARSFLHEYPQPEFDYARAETRAPKDLDFARVTVQVAARDPSGFVLLQARKLFDQWRAPFNDFEIDFGIPYAFQEFFHAGIVLLGAVGALAFWKKQPLTFVLVVGWLYIIVTNLIVPVERRYAFPGVPFALVLAGATLENFFAVATRREKLNRATIVSVALVGISAALLFAIYNLNRPTETRTILSSDSLTEINIQLASAPDEFQHAALYIDAMQLQANRVRATQNGQPLDLRLQTNRVFDNTTYATLLQRRALKSSDIPQWFRFDLNPRALQPNAMLYLQIQGPVILTRDAAVGSSDSFLPALDSHEPNSNTSLYKYLADGDFRIPRFYTFASAPDTSDSPFRVLLVLTRADGTQQILW